MVVLANGHLVLVLPLILPLILPLLRGILLRILLVLVLLPVVRLSLGFVLAFLEEVLRPGSVVLGAADCLKGKVCLFAQAEGRFVRGLYRVSWKELGAEIILAFGIRLNSIRQRKKGGKVFKLQRGEVNRGCKSCDYTFCTRE